MVVWIIGAFFMGDFSLILLFVFYDMGMKKMDGFVRVVVGEFDGA